MEKVSPEAIRVNLKMSQKDFANSIGLKTVRAYHYRLSGRTQWKGSELIMMARLAGISIDQIEF